MENSAGSSPANHILQSAPFSSMSLIDPRLSVASEKEAMLDNRRVTDLWFTPVGAVILIWMFYVACQVLGVSDPRRLSHGYDYRGRLCGVDLPDEPFVYWPPFPSNLNEVDLFSPICVKRCVTQTEVARGATVNYPNRTAVTELLPDGREITHVSVNLIPVLSYVSRKFGGQYCFPTDIAKAEILAKALSLTDEWMVVTRVFKSLQNGWYFLLLSGLVAIILSFAYLLLVADIAWVVCWITSSCAPLLLLVGSVYLAFCALTSGGATAGVSSLVLALDWAPVRGLLLSFSILGILISIFLFVSDSHLKQHSRKAVALAHATSRCLRSGPFVLIFPVIGTVAAVFVWILGVLVFVGLLTSPAAVPQAHVLSKPHSFSTQISYTTYFPPSFPPPAAGGHSEVAVFNISSSAVPAEAIRSDNDEGVEEGKAGSTGVEGELEDIAPVLEPKELRRLQIVQPATVSIQPASVSTFGILRQFRWDAALHWNCWCWGLAVLWLLELIHNLTQFSITFAASMWYFTLPDIRGRRDNVGVTTGGCIWVGLRYHLGTLELSALLLSTFRWLQFGAWAIRNRISGAWIHRRRSGTVLISVVQGCLKSLEDTARFLNSGGLVECTLHSSDFFPSCRTAWFLLQEQLPSVLLLGRVCAALSLINTVGLASTLSGAVLYITNHFDMFTDPASDWFVDSPAGLAAATFGLVAVIAHIVVFTFDQLTACLLYCFLVESQSGSGVIVFATDELRTLIEDNEAERRLEDLERSIPERSILSLSMLTASRGPETLDELLLSSTKPPGSWRDVIQNYTDGDLGSEESVRDVRAVEGAVEMNDVRW